ncbi:transcription repressor OFP12-like [Actinidia eriantha]|uniref:transcription repressor OFP12-like n=1 Tax=Actinidia eriantha TaxID=165200 RepID=UPI0025833F03|nr:transcription repressor OFP12-like [Actinidia eriantha]
MSHIFWKHFRICFSKFKCFSTSLPPPPPSPSQDHQILPSTTTTTSTTLIKTFNSLYDYSLTSDSLSSSNSLCSSSSLSLSSADSPPPDIAAVLASPRFFVPSPGGSNSIIDSPESDPPVAGSVAVRTESPDPYSDFRRSMQEMVEARELTEVKANWDYLHELLLCYLSLNPQHNHKFIIRAFADLLVSLMSSETADSHRQKPESRQSSAVSRRLL